jgi:RES domain-containing protein
VARNRKRGGGRPRYAPQAPRRPTGYLDSFTEQDLEYWHTRSVDAARYGNAVYFDLEKQRVAHHDQLVASLGNAGSIAMSIDAWVRITEYQWCLTPLSAAGSIKRIGGRFNIGSDLDLRAKPFPALYIAHDYDTAMSEYFSGSPRTNGALAMHELMLTRPSSFATIVLDGNLENVFDLRDHARMNAFVAIIRRFKLTQETRELGRRLGLPPSRLVQSAKGLQQKLFAPPSHWRTEPLMVDVPALSQIFGRYIEAAGFEGLLYPSQQGGTLCLAIYPRNFRGGNSYLEVRGTPPAGITCARLDRANLCLEGCLG